MCRICKNSTRNISRNAFLNLAHGEAVKKCKKDLRIEHNRNKFDFLLNFKFRMSFWSVGKKERRIFERSRPKLVSCCFSSFLCNQRESSYAHFGRDDVMYANGRKFETVNERSRVHMRVRFLERDS